MKKSEWKKKKGSSALGSLIGIAFFAIVACFVIYGLSNVEQGSSDEGKRILEESLRRAAVSCYSIEGAYPSSLAYLTDNYGVIIDTKKYAVHYAIFASNIMPDITVVNLIAPEDVNENWDSWEVPADE